MMNTSSCRSCVIRKGKREPRSTVEVGSGRNQKDTQHRKFLKAGQTDSLGKSGGSTGCRA